MTADPKTDKAPQPVAWRCAPADNPEAFDDATVSIDQAGDWRRYGRHIAPLYDIPIGMAEAVAIERQACARAARIHTHHALWVGLISHGHGWTAEVEQFGRGLAQRIEAAIRDRDRTHPAAAALAAASALSDACALGGCIHAAHGSPAFPNDADPFAGARSPAKLVSEAEIRLNDAGSKPDPLLIVADALECFWNAAVGSARNSQDATALAVAGSLAEGFAAMASRLRESADIAPSSPLPPMGTESGGRS